MTIDEAIKNLKDAKKRGVKSIVLAWWDAKMFDRKDNKEWEADAEYLEDQMDWSHAHDQMSDLLELDMYTSE